MESRTESARGDQALSRLTPSTNRLFVGRRETAHLFAVYRVFSLSSLVINLYFNRFMLVCMRHKNTLVNPGKKAERFRGSFFQGWARPEFLL